MTVRLLLVRHGQTKWNAQHRFQGQSDLPLTETGRRQALAARQRLVGEEIHAAYSSDLRRAWETAETIVAPHELSLRAEPRLREIYFGAWEGLTYDEIVERHPEALAAWEADPLNVPPPGGEALSQVASRVQAALDEIARAHRDETVLLVGHGGALQVLISLVLGLLPTTPWRFRLDSCSLSEIRLRPEGPVLIRLNESCNLVEPEDDSDRTL